MLEDYDILITSAGQGGLAAGMYRARQVKGGYPMSDKFKVLCSVNRFSGQAGGADKAGMLPEDRSVPAVDIPYPLGNHNLNKETERTLRREMVGRALATLSAEVSGPAHFE